jgi:hypothetical protein
MIMRIVPVILTALSMASPALAEDYEKGPNGGLMQDVAGIDAELLTSGNTVTINVFEAFSPKPVSTNGYKAAALIVSGANREPVTLTQSGENSLKGEAKKAIPPDATITLTIKSETGKSGQVRFKLGTR